MHALTCISSARSSSLCGPPQVYHIPSIMISSSLTNQNGHKYRNTQPISSHHQGQVSFCWVETHKLLYKKQFDKISGSRKQTVLLPVSARNKLSTLCPNPWGLRSAIRNCLWIKGTLPLSTACSTEIWDYLSKTEELSPQEKIDRWIFGSQVGSMDQVTLSNYWSPLNHHIHGRRGQTSPLQNCRASEQVGKYYCWKACRHNTIYHTSEFEVVHLSLYPKKSTKLLHIWWFQSAIHSHHISWRIEIICLIMSKLDLATMLHIICDQMV